MKCIDKMEKITVLLTIFMLCGCKEAKQESNVIEQNISNCSTTIYFQPLDDFTQQEAKQLQTVLEQRFRDIFNEDVWLCNVVHFLFGEHPEEIYFNVK